MRSMLLIMFHHGNLMDYLLKVFKRPTTSDNGLTPELNYYGSKTRVKFAGSCLK